MSKIQAWLGAAVEHDLRLASLWSRIGIDQNGFLQDASDLVRHEPSLAKRADEVLRRHDAGDFDPDEDRFSIARTTPNPEGGLVQLVRFLKKSAPVQAIISDGTTSTYVKFKAKSLQDYYKKSKCNFTDTRDGCLLRLQAFNIQATANESLHDQISLLVLDFDSLGLHQPPIGRPVPLGEVSGVKEALHILFPTLTALTTETPLEESFASQSPEVPPSPASVASQLAHTSVEQEHFETQLPFGSSFVASLPRQDVNFLSFVSKKPDLVLEPDDPPDAAHAPAADVDTAALSPAALPEPSTGGKVLAPIYMTGYIQHFEDNAGTTSAKTDKQDLTQAVKTSANEDMKEEGATRLNEPQGPILSASEARDPLEKQPGHSLPERDPWLGMRVPLPNIAVPKDQLDILARPHSWYPAEPGKAFPVANIPHAILQWAEGQVHRNTSAIAPDPLVESVSKKVDGKPTRSERLSKITAADGADESDASDGTQLSWEESSRGDDEDDSKSSIDPSPTMPSPLKSPAPARDPLPPDSSLPSPESPKPPRRPVFRIDSDDEMEYVEPQALLPRTSASLAKISNRRMTIELGSSRTPTATADAIPVTSLDGITESTLRPQFSRFTARFNTPPPIASPNADRDNEREGSEDSDHTSQSQREGFVTPPEIILPQQQTNSSPRDDGLAESVDGRPPSKTAEPKEKRVARPETAPGLVFSDRREREGSHRVRRSSQSFSQAQRSSPVRMQTSTPRFTKVSQSSVQSGNGESQDDEMEGHYTPPPLAPPVTFVQSTYPERSAQKRKPARDQFLSPPPKRVKQTTRGYGFSQDTPVLEDYRKEGRLQKKEFLRQYEARKEEALQDPEVSSAGSVSRDGSAAAEEDVDVVQSHAGPASTAAVRNRGRTSQISNESSSFAQVKDEAAEHQRAAATHMTPTDGGARRGLPWKQRQTTHGTPEPSRREPWSSHPSSPPVLAGWRERTRIARASSGRSSPQPVAARSPESHRPVSGSAFTPSRLSGAPSSRPSSRLGARPPQVASSGTSTQPTRHLSGTVVPVSRAGPAPLGEVVTRTGMQARHDNSSSLLLQRSGSSDDAALQPSARQSFPPAQRYMASTGSQTFESASQIDGPVVDLHQDFQKLKAVQRHLGTTEAEIRRRHTKRWSVLDWKLS